MSDLYMLIYMLALSLMEQLLPWHWICSSKQSIYDNFLFWELCLNPWKRILSKAQHISPDSSPWARDPIAIPSYQKKNRQKIGLVKSLIYYTQVLCWERRSLSQTWSIYTCCLDMNKLIFVAIEYVPSQNKGFPTCSQLSKENLIYFVTQKQRWCPKIVLIKCSTKFCKFLHSIIN